MSMAKKRSSVFCGGRSLSEPGKCPMVDHSMRAMAIGAAGELKVT
jgi:hypothetical protein